jgi:histidine ammonia-lyase
MGSISARKCAQVVEHVRFVLAIEALCAGQGLDLRAPLRAGTGVRAAHARLRTDISRLIEDRPLHLDIEAATSLIASGALVEAAQAQVGPLS